MAELEFKLRQFAFRIFALKQETLVRVLLVLSVMRYEVCKTKESGLSFYFFKVTQFFLPPKNNSTPSNKAKLSFLF